MTTPADTAPGQDQAAAEQFYCIRQFRTKVCGSRLMTRAEADREAVMWLDQIGPAAVVPATPALAHAVRCADQDVLPPLLPPAVPTAGVTEYGGYTVRAVLKGTQAEGELPNWTVAAERPDGSWRTWAVVNGHGPLLFRSPTWHEGADRKANRAAALAEFARRAGIEPGTIRFEAFDIATGERWTANDWRQEDRRKLTAYVTRTTSRGRSRVTLTFADGTQKTYPKGE